MAEPGDEIAAGTGGRGDLRVSHADREQAIDSLKAAFVPGRAGQGRIRSAGGPDARGADLRGTGRSHRGPARGATRLRPPVPGRVQGRQPGWRPGRVVTAATVLYAGVWVYAIVFPSGGDRDTDGVLVFLAGFVYLIILGICVGQAAALREKRSDGQSPRRPTAGAGGPAAQRVPSADPGRQLPPAGHGHQHTAEAVRRRSRLGNPHTMSAQVLTPAGL